MKRILIAFVLCLLLSGCAVQPAYVAETAAEEAGASVTGATLNKAEAGSEHLITIRVEDPDNPIGIDFRGTVASGNLQVQLLNETGDVVWERSVEVGPFAINEVVHPDAAGEYRLGLAWEGAVQAQYNLMWQPGEVQVPAVTAPALINGAGQAIVALAFIVYAATRRWGFGYLALGAAALAGSEPAGGFLAEWLRISAINLTVGALFVVGLNFLRSHGCPLGYLAPLAGAINYAILLGTNSFTFPLPAGKMAPSLAVLGR